MDVRNEERVVLRVRCQSLLVCTSHEGRRCGRDGCAGRCGGAIGGGPLVRGRRSGLRLSLCKGREELLAGGMYKDWRAWQGRRALQGESAHGTSGLESWTPEQLGRLQLGRRCERGLSGRLLSMGREGYGREEEEGAVTF
jgi:hypothetical protein